MGDVVPFKKRRASDKFKGRQLCRSGFHKWQMVQTQRFDVKEGRLVTVYQCARCRAIKNEAR